MNELVSGARSSRAVCCRHGEARGVPDHRRVLDPVARGVPDHRWVLDPVARGVPDHRRVLYPATAAILNFILFLDSEAPTWSDLSLQLRSISSLSPWDDQFLRFWFSPNLTIDRCFRSQGRRNGGMQLGRIEDDIPGPLLRQYTAQQTVNYYLLIVLQHNINWFNHLCIL